jgi:hypothetical protein
MRCFYLERGEETDARKRQFREGQTAMMVRNKY